MQQAAAVAVRPARAPVRACTPRLPPRGPAATALAPETPPPSARNEGAKLREAEGDIPIQQNELGKSAAEIEEFEMPLNVAPLGADGVERDAKAAVMVPLCDAHGLRGTIVSGLQNLGLVSESSDVTRRTRRRSTHAPHTHRRPRPSEERPESGPAGLRRRRGARDTAGTHSGAQTVSEAPFQ